MLKLMLKKHCCGCNACVQICPVNCITPQKDREGFFYPDIDEDINMDEVHGATSILKHMEFGVLVVNLPEDMSEVGLNLEGSCEWAEDDGIQWIIKNDKIVYVGPWQFQNMWRADFEDDFCNYVIK